MTTSNPVHHISFTDGLAIQGDCCDPQVIQLVKNYVGGQVPLIIADPPYGNIVSEYWDKVVETDSEYAAWMLGWTCAYMDLLIAGGAFYVWGGIGKPGFRPFYKYLIEAEENTKLQLANHLTFAGKRGYGIQHNYLFVRQELAYFCLGDIKKPRLFNVPLLEEERGYEGYNAKYPAKSKFKRRTNVWSDITEILRGKRHVNEKPVRLHEIPIEVHTQAGECVIDPFAGSGTTAEAARNLGRKFVVIERDEKEFQVMINRLNNPPKKDKKP